jgi:AcrR family transcriptional regulator
MTSTTPVKRTYRSPLREANARATRRAIIEAATRLFVERGYGATSVEAIAEAAGVSRATVFSAVGGKPTLLKTAYDVALVGDDEPISMPERADAKAVAAEPDPRRFLERYVALISGMHARLAPIYLAIRGAATSDPEARPVLDKIHQERRTGMRNVVAMMRAKGGLRADIDESAAADVLFVLVDPGIYHELVTERGWSPVRWQAWLADSLAHALMGDGNGIEAREGRGSVTP